jgi:hypothetical protein
MLCPNVVAIVGVSNDAPVIEWAFRSRVSTYQTSVGQLVFRVPKYANILRCDDFFIFFSFDVFLEEEIEYLPRNTGVVSLCQTSKPFVGCLDMSIDTSTYYLEFGTTNQLSALG